jgi:hypothetical protein
VLLGLAPFPQARPKTSCTIEVAVRPAPDGGLALRYRLRGALDQLVIPPAHTPGAADGLWRHTCFEAFVARAGVSAYREFNFSPCSRWAVYAFRGYRERDPGGDPVAAPLLAVARGDGHLEVDATIPAAALPPATAAGADLQVGLTAVVEHADGALTYWALRHPAAQPDFHHRDGFALRLDAAAFAPPLQGRP